MAEFACDLFADCEEDLSLCTEGNPFIGETGEYWAQLNHAISIKYALGGELLLPDISSNTPVELFKKFQNLNSYFCSISSEEYLNKDNMADLLRLVWEIWSDFDPKFKQVLTTINGDDSLIPADVLRSFCNEVAHIMSYELPSQIDIKVQRSNDATIIGLWHNGQDYFNYRSTSNLPMVVEDACGSMIYMPWAKGTYMEISLPIISEEQIQLLVDQLAELSI